MKVLYEPNEVESLEEIFKHHPYCFNGCDLDKTYAITFKVTNPALASYILASMLNDRLENFDIGIDVKSIVFDVSSLNKDEIKEKFHRMIDEL